MKLQERLKDDLKVAMKTRNDAQKETLRVVIGEMARSDKKTFSDDEVVGILKKLIKSEKELLSKSSQADTSPFIEVLEGYLPKMATEDEIREWIGANIDFGAYKNKMQAMGTIMAHFGASADGNLVKRVLQALPV
jgi:hypothetical protein